MRSRLCLDLVDQLHHALVGQFANVVVNEETPGQAFIEFRNTSDQCEDCELELDGKNLPSSSSSEARLSLSKVKPQGIALNLLRTPFLSCVVTANS